MLRVSLRCSFPGVTMFGGMFKKTQKKTEAVVELEESGEARRVRGVGADGDGNTLPDAVLVPSGTTAKGLAFHVHTDLGQGFIRAVDARTGRISGSEYEITDTDVIRIHSKS